MVLGLALCHHQGLERTLVVAEVLICLALERKLVLLCLALCQHHGLWLAMCRPMQGLVNVLELI